MKNIILISAPAGGKGTISKYIKDKYNFEHISIGDLLRNEVSKETEIGKKIDNDLKKGLLIDDNLLFEVLGNKLKKQKNNFILDGTPRTKSQAIKYMELLKSLNIELDKVIYVSVDKDVAESRISNRLVCSNCSSVYNSLRDNIKDNICPNCGEELKKRNDDKKATFEKRYEIFEKEVSELIDFFGNKVYTITNNSDISEAYKQIDNIF